MRCRDRARSLWDSSTWCSWRFLCWPSRRCCSCSVRFAVAREREGYEGDGRRIPLLLLLPLLLPLPLPCKWKKFPHLLLYLVLRLLPYLHLLLYLVLRLPSYPNLLLHLLYGHHRRHHHQHHHECPIQQNRFPRCIARKLSISVPFNITLLYCNALFVSISKYIPNESRVQTPIWLRNPFDRQQTHQY